MRLTNAHRRVILGALMDHRFKDEEARLEQEMNSIAHQAYLEQYGHHAVFVASAPPGWLYLRKHFRAVISGDRVELRLAEPRAFPAMEDEALRWPLDSELAQAYGVYRARKTALKEAMERARAMARAPLWRATTVEGLLRAWPEVRPYVGVTPDLAPAALPALPTEVLNEAFSLNKAA